LSGPEALHVYQDRPALAYDVKLRDELVGPACDDGLVDRVVGRMVIGALSKELVSASQRAHTLAPTG
jgi:hypothetical protein